jgi:hypothetical protein
LPGVAKNTPTAPSARRKKAWTFLRIFRWAVYATVTAFMLFLAICVAVGIIANITERYPELAVPTTRPKSLAALSKLQLVDCREALLRMRAEDLQQTQSAFTGDQNRDEFWRSYRQWQKQWRKSFENLSISCRLTEYRYEGHATLGSLAEIYRRIDSRHKAHSRLVKGYITSNAQTLREIRELFERTDRQLHLSSPGGLSQTPSP